MTNANRTAIGLVLDRSGSMTAMKEEAEQSLNDFVAQQRKLPGEVLFSYVTFNYVAEVVHLNVPLDDVGHLELSPTGGTALYDGIGLAIEKMGEAFAAMEEKDRPAKVLLVVLTDGMENASSDYTKGGVTALITEHQERWSWEILFLAKDLEVIRDARSSGVRAHNTARIADGPGSLARSMASVSTYAASYRQTGTGTWSSQEPAALVPGDRRTSDEGH